MSILTIASTRGELVRPLGGMRFTGEVRPGNATAASDGRDFLLLWHPNPDPRKSGLYGQRVSGGNVEPAFLIDPGGAWWRNAAGVWTGSHYIVASPHDDGIFIAVVSREGHVIRLFPRPVLSGTQLELQMTVNGGRAFVTALSNEKDGLVGILLDGDGNPVGPERKLYTRTLTYGVAAAGDGYAIAVGDWKTTTLIRVGPDGGLRDPDGTLIEGKYPNRADGYHSSSIAVGSDGTNILIAFVASEYQKPSVLKTAVVALDGSVVKPVATTLTMPIDTSDQGLTIRRLLADGTEYRALLAISYDASSDIHTCNPAFLRMTSSGEPIGRPEFVLRGPYRQQPVDAVPSRDATLVTWLTNTNQQIYGSFFAVFAHGSSPVEASPQRIGRGMAVQQVHGIGTRATDRLVAWSEEAQPGMALSIVGPTGAILKTAVVPLIPPSSQLSIASDGSNWLVMWTTWTLNALLFDAQLEPITQKPLALGPADSASASWNGKTYVVVYSDNGALAATTLSTDGRQRPVQKLLEPSDTPDGAGLRYSSPAIASLDEGSFVTFAVTRSTSTPFGGYFSATSPAALLIDSNGRAASPVISFPDADGEASVATDGERYAVVWRDSQLRGTFFGRDGTEQSDSRFVLDRFGSKPHIVCDGLGFLATWTDLQSIHMARINPGPLVYAKSSVAFEVDEELSDVVPAAGTSAPPIIAATQRSLRFENLWRAGFLLVSDVEQPDLRPESPIIHSATIHDDDTIDLAWTKQRNVRGYAVEAVGRDRLARIIQVVPPDSTSAHISLDTLVVSSIRMRSWNGAGFSDASTAVSLEPVRTRAVRRR